MNIEQCVNQRLAIEGGKPVRDKPLQTALGGAMIGEEEKSAVLEVLESQSLFRYYGPHPLHKVDQLERELALAAGSAHALAVSSGTAALRTALISLKIGRGDEVLMPAYSFLACPAAALTCGAIPVFVECDESLLLDVKDLEAQITPQARAILVVHNNGAASAMEPILDIAHRHGLQVIEDCAQALGATYRGKPVGSFGNISTFSLQYLKIITAGEGGAVATNDQETYQKAVYYHDLGFQRPGREGNPFAGENYRMSELTGAVGLEQLRKLPVFLERIRNYSRTVAEQIEGLSGIQLRSVPDPDGDQGSSLVLQFEDAEKARFFRRTLRKENIPCDGCFAKLSYGYPAILGTRITMRDGKKELCQHPDGEHAYRMGMCPQTEAILKRSVAITISPAYSDADIDDIMHGIVKVATHLPD